MRKRFISILLVLCMLLTMSPIQALAALEQSKPTATEQITGSKPDSNPFSDVKESDWFYGAVMSNLQKGLFKGTSDTTFSPQGTMTRAMYVTVMGHIAGINPAEYGSGLEFIDVSSDSWYAPYVNWAQKKGITSGVGNGKFYPNGLVTREQMAVLTVRFFDIYQITYPEATVTREPADLESIADYAREAVLKLWKCGVFRGDANGYFNPKNNATRAEAAAFCLQTDKVVENWFEEAGKKRVVEEKKEDKPADKGSSGSSRGGSGDNPGISSYQVTFMDGDTQLDRLSVKKDTPLGRTPDNQKTAKDGYIFVGWYTDKELTTPFYAQDSVTANLIVYAKYEKMVNEEVITLTSFAQMDQDPDLSFTVEKISDNAEEAERAITLMVMDGTEPVKLNISNNSNNTYTVSAVNGFREGSSYQLTLGDGYIFEDKAESIRTASFSIRKEEVNNLTLNEDMIFIKDTDEISYRIGNAEPVPVLEAALMNSTTSEAVYGTFDYSAVALKPGDVLCIYETVDPRQRDYINNDYADDAEAYVEVTEVSGNTVTFTSLDEGDAEKIIFMPDTIPFSVEELPTGETGTIQSTVVDNTARTAMGLNTDPEVEKGDFVVFYVGQFAELNEDDPVYYGVVTAVNGNEVSYEKTTKEEIQKSMDTFLQQSQKGEKLLEGVDVQALTSQIEKQVRESGFAEDAAEYLALMATQTDGFKTMSGLTELSLTDENGNALTAEEIQLMGIGANIKLSDKVKITVELDDSSKYFNDGIRLAVGIDAEFSVDVGDRGELKIDLSATFVEEVALDITAGAHARVKWHFFVPKFKELTFKTAVDIKNYAGISVDVKMYTVEKEEESVWNKLKGIKGGQYKHIFEQIEEVKSKIAQTKEAADKIKGYKKDLETLWAKIPADVTNKAEYEGMLETLGELNVTQELMGMLNLTNETELDAGVRNLMKRYSEMLENESDWIELVHKKIFHQDFHIGIFAIGIGADFVIKGNVNIALGANMEYVVGKRYSFWLDIVSKTSGSSEMDLLDEKFAFQFYVMGQLGLKMGVEAEICVGIISTKIGSIGLTAEFGPYIKMWGYFIYEYTKLRPANTTTWNYDEKMMGAIYLEFGLYLEITFKAQVLGLFKYQPTLLDKEWPLLTAGTRYNVYDYAYKIEADEVLPVRDEDSNSTNGISMTLPESYRLMSYIDLCEGDMEQAIYDNTKFQYTLSNRNFAIDENTGVITVNVPKDVQYMECDLTLTWKTDKLAFSLYDLAVTIPLVWTNLSTEELNQRFTASVRAGKASDGYTTVWTQRVKKNAPFDLPTEADVKKLLGVASYGAGEKGNLKYDVITGYGGQSTEGLTIMRDTTYYFKVTPRTYTLTVKDVQMPDGSQQDREFTAKFGETFDISILKNSGTNDDVNKDYTTFLNITAKDSSNKEILRDLTEPIGKAFAMELLSGATYTAAYADNSATALFRFEGIDLEPIEIKMKKGDVPSSAYFEQELGEKNAIVKSIFPAFAPITSSTTYTVVCESQEAPVVKHKITYNTNGGSAIAQQTYPVGSVITKPADPKKNGYTFAGWFSDAELKQEFTFTTMPNQDLTLYAKWSGQQYTISFDVNEGNPWNEGEGSKTVSSGETYGELPVPKRQGWGFSGWYTERIAGEKVTKDTVVALTTNQTLYAHWSDKAAIDENIISFAPNQSYDYNGEHQGVVFNIKDDSGIQLESFTVEYKRQNLDSSWHSDPVNAGTYDVRITRAEDEAYQSFEKTFTNVMTINKIERTINADPVGSSYKANLLIGKLPADAYVGDGTVQYAVSSSQSTPSSGWQESRAFMNLAKGKYYLFAKVLEGENYLATDNVAKSSQSFTVEGINVDDTMGYNNYFRIKTSDIKKAGTDSKIKGRYHYLDGTASDLTHFDNKGNDFEQGDLDNYQVSGLQRVPWMIKELEIDYTKDGSSEGWHCEYVQPFVLKFQNQIPKIVEGSPIEVNQWFGAEDHDQKHVVWKGSTDSMKRKITGVGNFEDISEILSLSSGGELYTFKYDGMVIDQYGKAKLQLVSDSYNTYDYLDAPALSMTVADSVYQGSDSYNTYDYLDAPAPSMTVADSVYQGSDSYNTYDYLDTPAPSMTVADRDYQGSDSYNAYDYLDAPALSITVADRDYQGCIDYKAINSFSIDGPALYAAMQKKGETEITLTVTLKFPERSTTTDTATWTKTITVRLTD